MIDIDGMIAYEILEFHGSFHIFTLAKLWNVFFVNFLIM